MDSVIVAIISSKLHIFIFFIFIYLKSLPRIDLFLTWKKSQGIKELQRYIFQYSECQFPGFKLEYSLQVSNANSPNNYPKRFAR